MRSPIRPNASTSTTGLALERYPPLYLRATRSRAGSKRGGALAETPALVLRNLGPPVGPERVERVAYDLPGA
jgi:hypothetical protein